MAKPCEVAPRGLSAGVQPVCAWVRAQTACVATERGMATVCAWVRAQTQARAGERGCEHPSGVGAGQKRQLRRLPRGERGCDHHLRVGAGADRRAAQARAG